MTSIMSFFRKIIFFKELVEKLVVDYITDTTQAALEIGKPNKITLEDITYVIRKDKRKGIFSPISRHITSNLRNSILYQF